MIKVDTYESLTSLEDNLENGSVAFVDDNKKYYMYHEETNSWDELKSAQVNDSGVTMNLYDLNKQVVAQFPPYDAEKLADAAKRIDDWRKSNLCMLYGQEIHYFTILKRNPGEADFTTIGNAVIELLHDITDKVYAVDVLENDAVEIWIDYNGNTTVLYLFDYTDGLVTFGE